MNPQTRQLLEDTGFQVIEGSWDFKSKTRTFVLHPDGTLNPFYNTLNEIPLLPNGTNIDLDRTAMPYDDEVYGDTAVRNAKAVTNVEWEMGLAFPLIIGYMVIAVVMLAIVICVYYLINPPAQQPPCGTEAKIIDVSDCQKIIIMPNCDSRTYDACSDVWTEESWHTWEPPASWVTWAVIGIVAVGAVIIAPQILSAVKSRRPSTI